MAKQLKDLTRILSKDNFSKFTKINEENVQEYYYNNSLFIVYEIVGLNHNFIHSFNGRKRYNKGLNKFTMIYDNTVKEFEFKLYSGETEDQYNKLMDDVYPYLKEQIKLSRLYALKI